MQATKKVKTTERLMLLLLLFKVIIRVFEVLCPNVSCTPRAAQDPYTVFPFVSEANLKIQY